MRTLWFLLILALLLPAPALAAQLVLIDRGTLSTSDLMLGDIVAVHDDDVELSGSGYENFKIIKMPGVSKEDVRKAITEKIKALRSTFTEEELEKGRTVKIRVPFDSMDLKTVLSLSSKDTSTEDKIEALGNALIAR